MAFKKTPTLDERLAQARAAQGSALSTFEQAVYDLDDAKDTLLSVAAEAADEATRAAQVKADAEAEAERMERVAGRVRDLLA